MPCTLSELAHLVGGKLVGADLVITGTATLADAAAGQITFVDAIEKLPKLAGSAASAVVVPWTATLEHMACIQVHDVQRAFSEIVLHFRPARRAARVGISGKATVSPTARLGANVDIHPGATIGDDAEIGDDCTLHAGVHIMAGCKIDEDVTIYPNAVLYENTQVGARSVIHAGAVLGAHGFGYKLVNGRHHLSAQLGHVVLGRDVEIGAGSTIDRGTYGPTTIGEGTKIDNQVMIAHNCRIGRHNLICSQVGIAGSTSTGDYVVLAGQVGVRDHVRIGERAVVGAKAGVSNDIPANEMWFGCPATRERDQKLMMAVYSRLPEMRKQLKALEATVRTLSEPHETTKQLEPTERTQDPDGRQAA